ncbi:hypothetical protein C3L23_00055 [Nautilia sp. PV-1]|uniref:hypothetical protein n=1 Tax=Nautilia sp. PV-1 TaxID=2579250 RepID=UPI000FDA0A1B|nr:hypothetical protein [Nautilia sp. PV-1]AZV45725.1 hypothetical protein C3L23_00055 [Nautilia sp. PV-1]
MRVILYTKDFNEKISEPVDVILSPQYYWIKKIDIPIKSLKDAKKLSKTLFKLDENYIYDAFKLNGKYFAYAIKKNLKINIDKKYINSIRLAQTELYNFEKINVSDKHSIQKVDDLLFCFPNVEDAPNINDVINSIQLSKNTVNIYNRLNLDKSILIYSAVILILLNFIFISGFIQNENAIKSLENQKESLIKKYNLPKTTFQLKSILNELKNEDNTQKKIRKSLEFITKTPLKKGEKFLKLSYDKYFNIEIKTDRNFDKYFSKKFKVTSSLKNGIYKASLYE